MTPCRSVNQERPIANRGTIDRLGNSAGTTGGPESTGSQIPCVTCHTVCCGAYRVYLMPPDLLRLRERLHVPVESLVMPVPLTDENAEQAAWSFSLGEEERFLLGLRRRAGRCLFLLNLGGARRCGVHAGRPLTCRLYPFTADVRRLRRLARALCPTPWPVDDATRHEVQVMSRRASREALQYEALLDTWHAVALPQLNADGVGRLAFRARFRRFLAFLDQTTAPAGA